MTPPLVLTSGDPSGVGLELSLKAWAAQPNSGAFFLIADQRHMAALSAKMSIPWVAIQSPDQAASAYDQGLPVLDLPFAEMPKPGVAQLQNAVCVISAIKKAVQYVQSGDASGLCTNPIHKKILQDGAGFTYPGHTEFLAHLSGVARSVMLLSAPELKVVPVTIHIALNKVSTELTPDLLEETIRITHRALQQDFGIPHPRLAVAGVNPHAGESGAMGDEEIRWIRPLVERLKSQGFNLSGPNSADTMFHPAARSQYDAAICMYHDQALIPIKTLNFSCGVNCTLGLPFIRTSPDHGTAFDIAGTGIADPSSLIAALELANEMAGNRRNNDDE